MFILGILLVNESNNLDFEDLIEEANKNKNHWMLDENFLKSYGNPVVQEASNITFLSWADCYVFDTINISIDWCSSSNKEFSVGFKELDRKLGAFQQYEYIKTILVNKIGVPSRTEEIITGYPITYWILKNFQIVLNVSCQHDDHMSCNFKVFG